MRERKMERYKDRLNKATHDDSGGQKRTTCCYGIVMFTPKTSMNIISFSRQASKATKRNIMVTKAYPRKRPKTNAWNENERPRLP